MYKLNVSKTVLLTVALAGSMASCQKEEFQSEMVVPSHEMSQKNLAHVSLTLRYWIDGVGYNASFTSEAEKSAYISYLIGLTLEGKEITIGGSQNPSLAPEADDKLTFTTSDKAQMDAWATEMRIKGYDVKITFDKESNLYTGTATKGGSRTTMAVSLSESE
ncbi:MAG: hypothetical protein J6V54_09970 [Bacteroidales bacterium]|nr:hypothetical protein [Bacteroidales bacterium]